MVENKLVSIIINCYNGEKFLREAIDSIYAQTYHNWEIIFWDNASTDASASIARSYDDRVKYFKSESLIQLCIARNLAIERCQGDVIAFLDCDDVWLPNKLESQLAIFQQGYKVVYGRCRLIDEDGVLYGKKKYATPRGWVTRKLIRRSTVALGSVMVDAHVLKEYQFDPVYDLIADFELWIRLSKNYKFNAVLDVVLLSRRHRTNLSKTMHEYWLPERRSFYRRFLKNCSVKNFPDIIFYILRVEFTG
jgi:glycosyltransferase involved in cell wall biosynthesis